MGYGHRNMYYATGQPGWMRLGYSPGWVGRSRSGMGPCAEYLATGRWPAAFTGEIGFLKTRADSLEKELERLRKRIAELEDQ